MLIALSFQRADALYVLLKLDENTGKRFLTCLLFVNRFENFSEFKKLNILDDYT